MKLLQKNATRALYNSLSVAKIWLVERNESVLLSMSCVKKQTLPRNKQKQLFTGLNAILEGSHQSVLTYLFRLYSRSDSTQFLHLTTNTKQQTKVNEQRSYVSSRFTADPYNTWQQTAQKLYPTR